MAYLVSLVLNLAFVLGTVVFCTRGLALATGGALTADNLSHGNVAAALIAVSMIAALLVFVWQYFGLMVISLGSLLLNVSGPGDVIVNMFNAVLALVLSLAAFRVSFALAKGITGSELAASIRNGDLAAAFVVAVMILAISYVLVQGIVGISIVAQAALLAPQ